MLFVACVLVDVSCLVFGVLCFFWRAVLVVGCVLFVLRLSFAVVCCSLFMIRCLLLVGCGAYLLCVDCCLTCVACC